MSGMYIYKTKSKSRTFQKGDEFHEALEWFIHQFETHDWTPEGTNWIGGEPCPHDPRCDLKHKYIITVTKVIDDDTTKTPD